MRKAVDKVQLINKLTYYMQYPFVRYALIVGVLIALCSSLFGATLVLKRFSFIGDGLSHVAFGAMAIGSVLKLTNNTVIVMPVTVAAAILILMSGQNAKLKGDAAIAMMSVGALAVGYLIMNVFSTSANVSGDVCSTLFGSTSILTLTMDRPCTFAGAPRRDSTTDMVCRSSTFRRNCQAYTNITPSTREHR